MDLKVFAQTVRSQAVLKMKEAILSGVFQPGDRLVESEMCIRLGVSRPSLREALRSLEAEKLIVIVPNKGPMIPVLTIEEAREIYSVRALLEGEAVSIFTPLATKADLNLMRQALSAFDAAVGSAESRGQLEATRQFYDCILTGCGNRLIEEILGTLMARITFLRSKSMSLEGRSLKSSKEMRAIFKAIVANDPQSARDAAVKHVQRACEAAMVAYSLASPNIKRSVP